MNVEKILSPAQSSRLFPKNPPGIGHRILVVDDEETILRLNATVLKSSGFEVDTAPDGALAWEALHHHKYDLLITDNKMPKVSGIDLLKKVHAVQLPLPVIMATGTMPEDEFAQAPWLKPAATLLKPYTLTELLVTVKLVLRAATKARAEIAPPPGWFS